MFIREYLWPTAAPVDAKNLLIDLSKEKFDINNANHRLFIEARLNHFTAKRDELLDVDQKIAMAVGICSLLYLGGLNGMLTLIGYGAIVSVAQFKFHRGDIAKAFDDALSELHAIYQWCNPVPSLAMPGHDLAIQLQNAIKPYMQDHIKINKWSHLFATTQASVVQTVYGRRFEV